MTLKVSFIFFLRATAPLALAAGSAGSAASCQSVFFFLETAPGDDEQHGQICQSMGTIETNKVPNRLDHTEGLTYPGSCNYNRL